MHMYPHKHITKNNKSKSVLGGERGWSDGSAVEDESDSADRFSKVPRLSSQDPGVAHNHLELQFWGSNALVWPLHLGFWGQQASTRYPDIHARKTATHINLFFKMFLNNHELEVSLGSEASVS